MPRPFLGQLLLIFVVNIDSRGREREYQGGLCPEMCHCGAENVMHLFFPNLAGKRSLPKVYLTQRRALIL